MHTGMLWFNNDPKVLVAVKIQQAIEYYCNKYRKSPDLVLVHPSMLDTNQRQMEVNGDAYLKDSNGKLTGETMKYQSTVRPYRPVLPGHIWVGIEDKN